MSAATRVGAAASDPATVPGSPIPGRWLFAAWAATVVGTGLWPVVRSHWPVSVAMAGGSFVGGSSPVAGGSVGFPLLVYVFDHPASLGRDFCLAIQSVGMVSASIYVLTRRRRLEWRILRYALAGAAVAMPVGMTWLAPNVTDVTAKILFSVLYASFGLLHLVRMRDLGSNSGPSRTRFACDPAVGVGVGVMGGLLASVLGVGADILLYGILVLLYHTDIKIAIPTAVLLMAFTSLVGVACALIRGGWTAASHPSLVEILPYWLAAAPIVVVGGPLGSLVSRFVPRRILLGAVATLCLSQYAWTCYHEHLDGWQFALAGVAVLAVNLALHLLFEFGRRSLADLDRS